jgi:hypothetical protein
MEQEQVQSQAQVLGIVAAHAPLLDKVVGLEQRQELEPALVEAQVLVLQRHTIEEHGPRQFLLLGQARAHPQQKVHELAQGQAQAQGLFVPLGLQLAHELSFLLERPLSKQQDEELGQGRRLA